MKAEPDITLDLHFLSTAQGGRKTSTPSNKFLCMFKIGNEYHDCQLQLDEVGPIEPGQFAIVPIRFLRPELLVNRLKHGQQVSLCEGPKEIAEGRVIEIFMNPCLQS